MHALATVAASYLKKLLPPAVVFIMVNTTDA
jgi:hypothetical protein